MNKLDPCVFCGGAGEIEQTDKGYMAHCLECGLSIGCPTEEEAIELWNHKPEGFTNG